MSAPMDLAITEALEGRRTGGIPIGAVLECDGRLYHCLLYTSDAADE